MGLSPYSNIYNAGILCMVETAMCLSSIKDNLVSILHVLAICVGWSGQFSNPPLTEPMQRQESPSRIYLDEFRRVIPTLRFQSLSCTVESDCSVCLVEFEPDAEINRLWCGHVFHKLCVEKWVKYSNLTCPLCRDHVIASI